MTRSNAHLNQYKITGVHPLVNRFDKLLGPRLDSHPFSPSGEQELLLDFGNGNCSAHAQILGTGMGMKNCIPNFWEWEREKIAFPTFGNGNETLVFPAIGRE